MTGFLRRVGLCLVAYAALAWVPLVTSEYHTHILVISLYYVILAVGWNLLAGYTGQFSLAHHTFAGIGAYTSALLVQRAGIPILAGVVAGTVVGETGDGRGALARVQGDQDVEGLARVPLQDLDAMAQPAERKPAKAKRQRFRFVSRLMRAAGSRHARGARTPAR